MARKNTDDTTQITKDPYWDLTSSARRRKLMDMATKMRHVALKIEQEAATRPIIQANTLADASSTLKTLKMMSSPPPSEP